MEYCKLSDAKMFKKYEIKKILENENDREILRRLQELGFLKGATIECTLKAPFGDPKAYFIKGSTIAIRNEIANNIYVEEV